MQTKAKTDPGPALPPTLLARSDYMHPCSTHDSRASSHTRIHGATHVVRHPPRDMVQLYQWSQGAPIHALPLPTEQLQRRRTSSHARTRIMRVSMHTRKMVRRVSMRTRRRLPESTSLESRHVWGNASVNTLFWRSGTAGRSYAGAALIRSRAMAISGGANPATCPRSRNCGRQLRSKAAVCRASTSAPQEGANLEAKAAA